jgi:hypothetical protein
MVGSWNCFLVRTSSSAANPAIATHLNGYQALLLADFNPHGCIESAVEEA